MVSVLANDSTFLMNKNVDRNATIALYDSILLRHPELSSTCRDVQGRLIIFL